MADDTQASTFKEPKPLTDAERKARWAELRNRPLRSSIYARCWNKDIYVRWVRKDDPNDISFHQGMGFKIVVEHPMPNTPNKRRFDSATPPNDEGHYVNGDVILMEAPKVDYDFYCNEAVELSRRRLEDGKDRFMNDARRMGITAFNKNKQGQVVVSD